MKERSVRYAEELCELLTSEGFVDVDVDLTVDEPLLSAGILDSLELVRLVNMLSDRYGVTITGNDLALGNFETCVRISLLLERRVAKAAAG
jgi:acyl carrier protein